MRAIRTILALLALAVQCNAATYYIDYLSGSDINSGTSPQSAWQRSPYMKGFVGSYIYAPGDRFIFKGGVTWPNSTLQYRITRGNTYHGVDRAWFVGPAWSRPVFDCELKAVVNHQGSSANTAGAGVLVDNLGSGNPVNDVTIEGLAIVRHLGALNSTRYSYGRASVVLYGPETHRLTLRDCYIGDWDLPPLTTGEDSGNGGGVAFKDTGAGASGLLVINCELTTENAAQKTGTALAGFGTVTGCVIHHVVQVARWSGTITDNYIYEFGIAATDPRAHENGIYNQGISKIWGNLMWMGYAQGIYSCSGAFRTGNSVLWNILTGAGITTMKNNTIVMAPGAFGAAVELEFENLGGAYGGTPEGVARTGEAIYNNTLVRMGGPVARCTTQAQRPGQRLGYLMFAGNHCITDTSPGYSFSSLSVTNPIVDASNVVQSFSAAAAAGFDQLKQWAPSREGTLCFRRGLDLSAAPWLLTTDRLGVTRSVPPDVGAYQFGSGPPPPIVIRYLDAVTTRAGIVRIP